jgi:hypothetical protein
LGVTPEGGTDTATVEWVQGELGTVSAGQVFRETLAGTIDGTNPVFTTAFRFQTGTTMVFHNGLLEYGYTEVDHQTVEFDEAPLPGAVLLINYMIAG